jgi:hypothetical protein
MGHFAGELQTENIINFLSIFSNVHGAETVFGWKIFQTAAAKQWLTYSD